MPRPSKIWPVKFKVALKDVDPEFSYKQNQDYVTYAVPFSFRRSKINKMHFLPAQSLIWHRLCLLLLKAEFRGPYKVLEKKRHQTTWESAMPLKLEKTTPRATHFSTFFLKYSSHCFQNQPKCLIWISHQFWIFWILLRQKSGLKTSTCRKNVWKFCFGNSATSGTSKVAVIKESKRHLAEN